MFELKMMLRLMGICSVNAFVINKFIINVTSLLMLIKKSSVMKPLYKFEQIPCESALTKLTGKIEF